MKGPPQFFEERRSPSERTDRAVYTLNRKDGSGHEINIAVECVEGGGNVPRSAASFRDLPKKFDLEKELETVSAIAEDVLNSLTRVAPDEVEVTFGVELGAEMGFPMVTKGTAKANFTITLKWARGKDGR